MVIVMNKLLIAVVIGGGLLAGCSSTAKRMAECEAQGVSKDTCYLAEQNRQNAINEAAYNAQWANARDAVKQKAQAAKKAKTWQGMKLVFNSTGLVVDGKPAAIIEKAEKATVYQEGLFHYTVYTNGRIAVTDLNGVFKGYAK